MKDAARMSERNCFANAQEQPQAILHRFHVLDEFVEALAFDKFHGVEDASIRQRAYVVHGHYSGMFKPCEHAGFAHQTVRQIAILARYIKHFQRDATFQLFVFRGVNDAHAAASHAFEQTIACAGKIRLLGARAQTLDRFVRERFHFASQPNTARASRWNSSSLPQISRSRSSAPRRNSRRAQDSAFVTSVTGIPYSAASLS